MAREKLNRTYYVQGGPGHSGDAPTLAAAKSAAQQAANATGRTVTVREDWDEAPKRIRVAGKYRMGSSKHVYKVVYMAKPKAGARSNPARSNPSDSALAGARILGVTRNRAGKVTALKLQLKAGAGGGGVRKSTRKNPAVTKIPIAAMKYERERERYPNGVTIRAQHVSGRSYVYIVGYDRWREKTFNTPAAARKFAERQSK